MYRIYYDDQDVFAGVSPIPFVERSRTSIDLSQKWGFDETITLRGKIYTKGCGEQMEEVKPWSILGQDISDGIIIYADQTGVNNSDTVSVDVAAGNDQPTTASWASNSLNIYLGTDSIGSVDESKASPRAVANSINTGIGFIAQFFGDSPIESGQSTTFSHGGDSFLKTIWSKKNILLQNFHSQFKNFYIRDGVEDVIFSGETAAIRSISFEESQYSRTLDYTVTLDVWNSGNFTNFYGVVDPQDTISFSEADDGIVNVSRNMSARGLPVAGKSAYENARDYINSISGKENITVTPLFASSPNTGSLYLTQENFNVNRLAGTYGIQQSWVYDEYNTGYYTGVTVRTTTDLESGNGEIIASLQGNIQGGINTTLEDLRNAYNNIDFYSLAKSVYESEYDVSIADAIIEQTDAMIQGPVSKDLYSGTIGDATITRVSETPFNNVRGVDSWSALGTSDWQGIAITKRHVLFVNHWEPVGTQPSPGSRYRFYDISGNLEERTVVTGQTLSGTDIRIILLNSDLVNIRPQRIVSEKSARKLKELIPLGYDIPIVGRNQYNEITIMDLNSISSFESSTVWTAKVPTDPDRLNYYYTLSGSDSSNPQAVYVNNELLLVGHTTSSTIGLGPVVGAYEDEVNQIIQNINTVNSVTGSYSIETVDIVTQLYDKPRQMSVNENSVDKSLSFNLSYTDKELEDISLVDSFTASINFDNNIWCAQGNVTIRSNYGSINDRWAKVKNYYESFEIKDWILQKWTGYGYQNSGTLEGGLDSMSYTEDSGNGIIRVAGSLCEKSVTPPSGFDHFNYSISSNPALVPHIEHAGLEEGGDRTIQKLGGYSRSTYTIQGDATKSECVEWEAANDSLSSKINEIRDQYVTGSDVILTQFTLQTGVSETKNLASFSASWSCKSGQIF